MSAVGSLCELALLRSIEVSAGKVSLKLSENWKCLSSDTGNGRSFSQFDFLRSVAAVTLGELDVVPVLKTISLSGWRWLLVLPMGGHKWG